MAPTAARGASTFIYSLCVFGKLSSNKTTQSVSFFTSESINKKYLHFYLNVLLQGKNQQQQKTTYLKNMCKNTANSH